VVVVVGAGLGTMFVLLSLLHPRRPQRQAVAGEQTIG
jgi:hypothetical protein